MSEGNKEKTKKKKKEWRYIFPSCPGGEREEKRGAGRKIGKKGKQTAMPVT